MGIKVKATAVGYYGEKFRKVGDCFEVGDKEFTGKYKLPVRDRDGVVSEIEKDVKWPAWMEKVSDEEFSDAHGEEASEDSDEPGTYHAETHKKKSKHKAKKHDSADNVI